MTSDIDTSTLSKFAGVAAGHEGALSDASGILFIKPCHPTEVSFYEKANASHPDFAYFMPRFMGTLQLGEHPLVSLPMDTDHGLNPPNATIQGLQTLSLPFAHTPSSSIPEASALPTVARLQPLALPVSHAPSSPFPLDATPILKVEQLGPLWGKKLDTDLHIVLENIAAGFKQPNIMDLKLGSRLWDEDAKPEKRARLDKVASETTSGSLGFRIAGMRVWQGERKDSLVSSLQDVVHGANDKFDGKYSGLDHASNYRSYNKFYGRQFNAENVIDGFREYLLVPSAGVNEEQAAAVAQCFLRDIKELQEVLEEEESRIYSSSILLVYEGDPVAFREAVHKANNSISNEAEQLDEEEDDDEDTPKIFAIKLIDFAHADFHKGIGPDENMLQGVRSTVSLLERLIEEFDHGL